MKRIIIKYKHKKVIIRPAYFISYLFYLLNPSPSVRLSVCARACLIIFYFKLPFVYAVCDSLARCKTKKQMK